jgi:soluble lytic murein transglycosylase-like protein
VLAIGLLSATHAAAQVPPVAGLPTPADDPAGLLALALRYEHAEGVPRDLSKAFALYCSAAKMGHGDAQYALGWMYFNGRGVARDDDIASRLFAMAAAQGHAQARELAERMGSAADAPLPACLLPDPPAVAEDPTPDFDRIYPKGPIRELVQKLAPRYEVDPKFALAIIRVESGFNIHARSPKNAQGLMQLMPDTAQRFRVKNTFDAEDNINGGLAYLRWLLAYFEGNVPLVAAAYNAGEKAVEKHGGVPPYSETREYVRKITELYRSSTHPYRRDLIDAASRGRK